MTDSQPARGCDPVLLPCPFCGSMPIMEREYPDEGWARPTCKNYDCPVLHMEWSGDEDHAIERWNTRVAGVGESTDALKIRELCHNIIRACKATDGGPFLAIADEAARRILEELRRAAREPVAGGGGEDIDRIQLAIATTDGLLDAVWGVEDENRERIACAMANLANIKRMVAALQVKP